MGSGGGGRGQLVSVGNLLLDIIFSTLHNGAIEKARLGFHKLCEKLLRCHRPQVLGAGGRERAGREERGGRDGEGGCVAGCNTVADCNGARLKTKGGRQDRLLRPSALSALPLNPEALNPKPEAQNPNPKPEILNPKS